MANQVTTLKMGQKFKQTPAGAIPVDWTVQGLGDIVDIQIGGTPSRSNSAYWDTQLTTQNHWATIADMKGRHLRETKERLSDLGIANSNAKRIPKGTVVMSFKLTIGRVAITDIDLYTNEAIAAFVPRRDITSDFLYYVLPNIARAQEADVAVKGNTLNKAKLNDMLVALPPLREQEKIAEILTSIDDAIDKTNDVCTITQDLKDGLMQALLLRGMRRSTARGQLPSGWKTAKLADVCLGTPEYGANAAAQEYAAGSPRYIRITDIADDGSLLQDDPRSIPSHDAEPYLLHEGDFLFARSGATVGKTYLYHNNDGLCAFAGYLIRFRPDPKRLLPEYLSQFCHSAPYYSWVKSMLRAGAQPNINATEYADMQLNVPPVEEQHQILNILRELDGAVSHESKCKKQLGQMKRGLLHSLLTGKLRTV